jgi:catechol 2,3-dioxygenase-like lactoylglutathione lyase family enzyme
MAVQLNHTIVHALDPEASARFLSDILGVVELANGVSLDFIVAEEDELIVEHYAFLVDEPEFDTIFGRIRERGLPFWADPAKRKAGQINTHDGGRGVYWNDPNGHMLEIITRPYGSGE